MTSTEMQNEDDIQDMNDQLQRQQEYADQMM